MPSRKGTAFVFQNHDFQSCNPMKSDNYDQVIQLSDECQSSYSAIRLPMPISLIELIRTSYFEVSLFDLLLAVAVRLFLNLFVSSFCRVLGDAGHVDCIFDMLQSFAVFVSGIGVAVRDCQRRRNPRISFHFNHT